MARSNHIWVVQDDEGQPYMAFTVRHELIRYIRSVGVDDISGVVRLRDGQEAQVLHLDPILLLEVKNG